MAYDPRTGIYYEVHGSGSPLFLGFPLMASHAEIFGEARASVLSGFLDGLTDRYRVLVADYPNIGKSMVPLPDELTAERVSADFLSVADAAGFDRFALWAYSWGANAALQLASRTNRLSALVIGGWSPLGAPYAEILQGSLNKVDDPSGSSMVVLRNAAQYSQWVTYNKSVMSWPEAEAVVGIKCPRMVFFADGGDTDAGGIPLPYASAIRKHRSELEALGWKVVEIPNSDHSVGVDPAIVVPLIRGFLDDHF